MKYQGSKRRIAKYILPIILKDRKNGQFYVEPFCGGGNSICRVTGERIGSDLNPYLIELWKGLLEGKRGPFSISRELYNKARSGYQSGILDFEIAWIGFVASFNGRFFDGGYAQNLPNRNFHLEQIRNIEQQIPSMKGVQLFCCDYRELKIPPKSIIYCDPPYKSTKEYEYSVTFSHDDFYKWCREKHSEGHSVFISEFAMPEDFTCIWERELSMGPKPSEKFLKKEKLFTLGNIECTIYRQDSLF